MKDIESLEVLHELGAIPPLLELLKSDFPVIQHLALQTFQRVTTDLETRKIFREEQGFERFMDLLDNMVSIVVCPKYSHSSNLFIFIMFQAYTCQLILFELGLDQHKHHFF